MNTNLFRKQAMDKLQSPDRLNEMVKITKPHHWLAMLAIGIIILYFIVWSVTGRLPNTVNGKGILLQSGGVMEVPALASGQVERVLVSPGEEVIRGQVVVKVEQPEMRLQILNTENQLKLLKEKYQTIKGFDEKDMALKSEIIQKKAWNKRKRIEKNIERIEFVKTQIEAREELLEKGLITQEMMNNTRLMLFEIEQQNLVLQNELEEMQLNMFEMAKQTELELNNLTAQIIDLEARLGEMNNKYVLNSEIKSPYSGKVVELMVDAGSIVSPGSYILSIEREENNQKLEAIIYVSPDQGKKIKRGMEAKVSPSTVEVEKFGFIKGRVLQVSEYPATSQGMLNTLGTKELVSTFAQGLPPIAVRVRLSRDKETPSGFEWTSGTGPKLEVKSGTLCNSQIIVHNKRPISLVFPTFDE